MVVVTVTTIRTYAALIFLSACLGPRSQLFVLHTKVLKDRCFRPTYSSLHELSTRPYTSFLPTYSSLLVLSSYLLVLTRPRSQLLVLCAKIIRDSLASSEMPSADPEARWDIIWKTIFVVKSSHRIHVVSLEPCHPARCPGMLPAACHTHMHTHTHMYAYIYIYMYMYIYIYTYTHMCM